MKTPTDVAEKLKKWRVAKGLTQQDVAKAWGVPLATIRNWEQGRRRPTPFLVSCILARLAYLNRHMNE